MSTQATNDINTAFQSFSHQMASQLKIDDKALHELEQREATHPAQVPGLVGISGDIPVPVSQGYGSYVTPTYPTFWATFQGTASITAPNDGAVWTIVVTDIAQNKQIFSGSNLSYGDQRQFSYSTGFTVQVKAEAWCNNPNENTNLVVHIDLS